LDSQVNYESDLDSLLPNLFISIKLNHSNYINKDYHLNTENNFSRGMSLENYLILYKPFFIHVISNLPDIQQEKLEKDKEKELRAFQNINIKVIEMEEIQEFRDIMEKDEYFSAIKNPDSIKTILFLAELFTENSKYYKEVLLYIIFILNRKVNFS